MYFESVALPVTFMRRPGEECAGPIKIVLEPRQALDFHELHGLPVIPRAETIVYMREHSLHLQAAFMMLDRTYDDLNLDEEYRESERFKPRVSTGGVRPSSNTKSGWRQSNR